MEITIQEIQSQLSHRLRPVSETSSLDGQVLIAHFLRKPRSWILAHPEFQLNDEQQGEILQALDRLLHGEALPYVIGHWEFYGMDFNLTPDVLIPRPETEQLVERAIQWLQLNPHRRKLIDVGTGSGNIGIAIAGSIPDAHVEITDISAPALRIARQNLEKHNLLGKVETRQSDLFSSIPKHMAFDLICANLPYIPNDILSTLPVSKSEPRIALDGGKNGLRLIKRLLRQAKNRLEPGGIILLELDPAQCEQVSMLAQKHFAGAKVHVLQDLAGRDRCIEIETRYKIFHLCESQAWLNALQDGIYRADSLDQEGFIHCSMTDQVLDVANRYYRGHRDMVVLAVDPEKLHSKIRWEKSGNEYYPHIYGPINLDAVCSIEPITPGSDGDFRQIFTHAA